MLEQIKPENVMKYFEQICAIPHGSGDVEAISDFCVEFAKSQGLKYRQDEMENVVIFKEGSAGYENAPSVILQGHMDMVCEKNSDIDFDFEKDGLKLGIDGDYLHANGTTLGGDDGIALAMIMAILSDPDLKHPPIEAVFTTDEETGMDGARFLDVADLKGKYMINIDSEEEGSILTSCAGGVRSDIHFNTEFEKTTGLPVTITVKGLLGGHSGTEIHQNRANANILMGRVLFNLFQNCDFSVVSINGGLKDNAIPREAQLTLVIAKEELSFMEDAFKNITNKIKNEFRTADPDINITLNIGDAPVEANTLPVTTLQKVMFMLYNAPNGVQSMSAALPGLVETSLNLGIVTTEEDAVVLRYSVRSSVASLKELITSKLCYMTEFLGGIYEEEGDYPGWEYKEDSTLRTLAIDVFKQLYNKEPEVCAIHAGLECGLIAEKIPNIDIISIGPNIYDIHTPGERLSLSSTQRTYDYLVKILEQFPKYCQ